MTPTASCDALHTSWIWPEAGFVALRFEGAVGGVVSGCGAAVTTAVASDRALELPPPLPHTRTTTRIACPTSAAVSRYVLADALMIFAHDAPDASQRCHAYA